MFNSVNMLIFYIIMNNLFEIKSASVIAGNFVSSENDRKYKYYFSVISKFVKELIYFFSC